MTYKRTVLVLLVAIAALTGAFASGNKDSDSGAYGDRQGSGGRPSGGPQGGRGDGMNSREMVSPDEWAEEQEERHEALLDDAESYEGRFTMVENLYPALVDGEGDTWYLMIHFPIAEDSVPGEGADIKVKALPSRMSPVHLMVLEAEIDGEVLEPDWDQLANGGMQDKSGGRGDHGGRDGRSGNRMSGGPGGSGGPGIGWGAAAPEDDTDSN